MSTLILGVVDNVQIWEQIFGEEIMEVAGEEILDAEKSIDGGKIHGRSDQRKTYIYIHEYLWICNVFEHLG